MVQKGGDKILSRSMVKKTSTYYKILNLRGVALCVCTVCECVYVYVCVCVCCVYSMCVCVYSISYVIGCTFAPRFNPACCPIAVAVSLVALVSD